MKHFYLYCLLVLTTVALSLGAGATALETSVSQTNAQSNESIAATTQSSAPSSLPMASPTSNPQLLSAQPEINVSPLFFEEHLISGQTATQFLTIENTASGNLTWEISVDYINTNTQQATTRNSRNLGNYADTQRKSSKSLPVADDNKDNSIRPNNDAGNIIATYAINVPNTGMVWANGSLYILNYNGQQLLKCDIGTESVIETHNIHAYPYGITWDGEYLWIGNSSGNFYAYNLDGTSAAFSFSAPYSNYSGIAWDGQYFIVNRAFSNNPIFYRLDATGTTIETFSSGFNMQVNEIDFVPAHINGHVWATNNSKTFQLDLQSASATLVQEFNNPINNSTYSIAHNDVDLWWSKWSSPIYQIDDGIKEGDWLDFNNQSGSIPSNDSQIIEVTFNAEDLYEGVYEAIITVNSNDPNRPTVDVPVTLHVTGEPAIEISAEELDFGNVKLSAEHTMPLTITNTGTAELVISDIQTSGDNFYTNETEISVNPGQSSDLLVMFNSSELGVFEGELTFNNNIQGQGGSAIPLRAELINYDLFLNANPEIGGTVTGEGKYQEGDMVTITAEPAQGYIFVNWTNEANTEVSTNPTNTFPMPASQTSLTANFTDQVPQIQVNPDHFEENLDVGETLTRSLSISNTSLGSLSYNILKTDIIETDEFGYSWGTVPNNWIDASSGTSISLSDDDYASSIPLGFDFEYYGDTYNQINIMSNGWVSFTSENTWYPSCVPNSGAGYGGVIAPLGIDLNPAAGGSIYYLTQGAAPNRKFIVEFNNVPLYGSSVSQTLQVVLHEKTGEIVFQYLEAPLTPNSIGIEDPTGTIGIGNCAAGDLYINPNIVESNMAISFSLNNVTLSSNAGDLLAGEEDQIDVILDATSLEEGTHESIIEITSNDPDKPLTEIPVTLHVTGYPDISLSHGSLNFGNPRLSEEHTRVLTITNTGTSTLEINNIQAQDQAYHTNETSLTLTPGQSYDLAVYFSSNTPGVTQSALTFSTNVQGQESFSIPLTAEILVYDVVLAASPTQGGTVEGEGQYQHNDAVSTSATPAQGYSFVNWTENGTVVSGSQTYNFNATQNRTLAANFNPINYTLTLSVNNGVAGDVAKEPDQTHYNVGDVVTLTATPANGYIFSGWYKNGELISNQDVHHYSMPAQDVEITAHFVEDGNAITISATADPNGAGKVNGSDDYNQVYTNGEEVVLGVNANEGYTFVNWTENDNEVSTDETYTFNATQDRTLVANFSVRSYTISTSVGPVNSGSVSGAGNYTHGETVTLTATASDDYTFVNWTQNGVPVSSDETITFTATKNRTLVANFNSGYTISASVNPENSGTVSGAGHYDYRGAVSLTATANEGYTFVRWIENGTEVSTSETYTFTATNDRTLVALFSIKSYTISASVEPANSGKVTGANTYEHGATVSLAAEANEGYAFSNWTENGTEVSESASYTFTASANRTLIANFEQLTGIESSALANLKAYPNPFNESITLKNNEGISRVIITSLIGQRVMDVTLDGQNKIKTSHLSNGIYLVEFHSNNGHRIVKRMVKQ